MCLFICRNYYIALRIAEEVTPMSLPISAKVISGSSLCLFSIVALDRYTRLFGVQINIADQTYPVYLCKNLLTWVIDKIRTYVLLYLPATMKNRVRT